LPVAGTNAVEQEVAAASLAALGADLAADLQKLLTNDRVWQAFLAEQSKRSG
jgi:hypothetical protein